MMMPLKAHASNKIILNRGSSSETSQILSRVKINLLAKKIAKNKPMDSFYSSNGADAMTSYALSRWVGLVKYCACLVVCLCTDVICDSQRHFEFQTTMVSTDISVSPRHQ